MFFFEKVHSFTIFEQFIPFSPISITDLSPYKPIQLKKFYPMLTNDIIYISPLETQKPPCAFVVFVA